MWLLVTRLSHRLLILSVGIRLLVLSVGILLVLSVRVRLLVHWLLL